MVNDNKKDTTNTFLDSKTFKYIKISLISLVVIASLCIAIAFILLFDSGKNKHIDSKQENTEIITNNFVNGFSNTSTDGVFSFKLSKEDINQMLYNASKDINDPNIESIYYEQVDALHYFYIDIPRNCMVPSRVVIETYVTNIDGISFELKINKVSKGKLDIFDKAISKGYLSTTYVCNISKYTCLPISYDELNKAFKVDVLSIMEYFPKGEIKEAITSYMRLKEDKYFSLGDSLFDFNIDLSSLRASSHIASPVIGDNVDIKKRIKDMADSFDTSSISIDEETELCVFDKDEYSNYLSKCIDNSMKETYSSPAISKLFSFEVKYVFIVPLDNKVKYIVNISIAGYEIDVTLFGSVMGSYPGYRSYLTLLSDGYVGDNNENTTVVVDLTKKYLSKVFVNLADRYDFFVFTLESGVFGLDFSSVVSDITRFDISLTKLVINNKFSLMVKRVF